MKRMFPGYFLPTDTDLTKLWREGIIILDTNVLLNIYRYPEQAKADFIKVLENVSDRLWIPHHVALEYNRNRVNVIIEQNRMFDEVKLLLDDTESKLTDRFQKLQLKKRHSSIDPEHLMRSVKTLFFDYKDKLDRLKKRQLDIRDEDDIRNKVDTLFKEKIGPPPTSQEELNKIYEEGEYRYKNKIPPGYMDEEKYDKKNFYSEYVCEGLIYKSKYSDLVIWDQIIKVIKDNGFKYIIFITNDEKSDWWWSIDSNNIRLGPRPELVEEIKNKANVDMFYMYNSEQFMEYSDKYLKVKVHKDSIDEVRNISKTLQMKQTRIPYYKYYESLNSSVYYWLCNKYPGLEVTMEKRDIDITFKWPDFSVKTLTGEKLAFDVKKIVEIPLIVDEMKYVSILMNVYKKYFNKYNLIIVIEDESSKDNIWKTIISMKTYSNTDDIYLARLDHENLTDGVPNLEILYEITR